MHRYNVHRAAPNWFKVGHPIIMLYEEGAFIISNLSLELTRPLATNVVFGVYNLSPELTRLRIPPMIFGKF